MYRALYRKYRPETFADVVGQDAITTALTNQILANKIGHAYLFTGTRGTGKTTCAKIFAKAVNCENPQGANPCGQCVTCVGLANGSILDVIEIDAASNNSVDDIRDLRDETAYRPSRCKYKVYIIDEVHMLSTSAFNALLKIMEEPPSHIIFILATTEIHKVPATILSRCQRYDFLRISPEYIASRLMYVAQEENITLTQNAADLLARLADGALRDGVSLLDTCSGAGAIVDEELVRKMAGVADKSYLFSISGAVQAQDIPQLLQLVAVQRDKSLDIKRLTEELIHHYRNIMLVCAVGNGSLLTSLPEEDRARYTQEAPPIGEKVALRALRRLIGALDKMGRSPNPGLELELALFDLAEPLETHTAGQQAAVPSAPTKQASAAGYRPAPQHVGRPLQVEAPVAAVGEAVTQSNPVEVQPQAGQIQQEPANTASELLQEQTDSGVFEAWPKIVAQMAKSDRMLYTYMKQSNAYLDGRRVLIDGGDMFLSYMREYAEAGDKIKDIIQEVTGIRYAIGPYTAPADAPKAEVTAQDTLREWEEKGVSVEYE